MISFDFVLDESGIRRISHLPVEQVRASLSVGSFKGEQRIEIDEQDLSGDCPILGFALQLWRVEEWLSSQRQQYIIHFVDEPFAICFDKAGTAQIGVLRLNPRKGPFIVSPEQLVQAINDYCPKVFATCAHLYPPFQSDPWYQQVTQPHLSRSKGFGLSEEPL